MPWHRTGKVTLKKGSKEITGLGTLWSTSINPGDAFALVDANDNPAGAWYEVEKVNSNTSMTLKQTYAGSTGSNKKYVIFNLVGNMTTPSFAQRLAKFFEQFSDLKDMPTATPMASCIPIAGSNGKLSPGWLPEAREATSGAVELATTAEAQAGTDTTRAITPLGLTAFSLMDVKTEADLNSNAYITMRGKALTPVTTLTNLPTGWPNNRRYIIEIIRTGTDGYMYQIIREASHATAWAFLGLIAIRGVFFTGAVPTFEDWAIVPTSKNPKLDTFLVTSTDNATSPTSAPLRSAGGAAVAKDLWVVGSIQQDSYSRKTTIREYDFEVEGAIRATLPANLGASFEIILHAYGKLTGKAATIKNITYANVSGATYVYETGSDNVYAYGSLAPEFSFSVITNSGVSNTFELKRAGGNEICAVIVEISYIDALSSNANVNFTYTDS